MQAQNIDFFSMVGSRLRQRPNGWEDTSGMTPGDFGSSNVEGRTVVYGWFCIWRNDMYEMLFVRWLGFIRRQVRLQHNWGPSRTLLL